MIQIRKRMKEKILIGKIKQKGFKKEKIERNDSNRKKIQRIQIRKREKEKILKGKKWKGFKSEKV